MNASVQTAATAPANDDEGRSKIADRDWINDAGEVVDEDSATGIRYTFLGRTKDGVTIPPDGESFAVYFRDIPPRTKDLLCGFGAITLFGNVCNTWMTNKNADRQAKASHAIKDRYDYMVTEGKWIDKTASGGVRVDRDILAQAIVNVAERNGKVVEVAVVRAKLDDDKWMTGVRQQPEVQREYSALMGRTVKSVGDILSDLGLGA